MSSNDARRVQFWRLADELRGSVEGRSPLSVLRIAALRGMVPTWRDQAEVALEVGINEEADPAVVADFLLAFTDDDGPMRVLDPWAGLGITVAALEAEGRVRAGTAIEINQDVYEVIMALRGGGSTKVDWLLDDAAHALEGLSGEFDLIVGSPPIGLPNARLDLSGSGSRLVASKTYTMLVQAARLLARDGTMAVVLPESFFGPRRARVRAALEAEDVFPSAALALPLRDFPSSIAMSLVLFTHVPHDDLFLAELDSSADPRPIVANLRDRKAGRLPQLGRIVAPGSSISWRSTLLAIEIESLGRAMHLRPVPLSDLCTAIRSPRRDGEAFDLAADAVYIPSIGTSPAVASLDALVIKPQNYIQVQVRREVVDPEFLAGLFNSPLGRKIREQVASGATIRHISSEGLRGATAYLPPTIDLQRAAVRVDRNLAELNQAISGLRRRLWEQPTRAGSVEADLKTLLVGDGLDRWRDSLPFPLASILWRYDAEDGAQRRCEYLIHFFEAAALILVDIHLSALHRDTREFLEAARRESAGSSYSRGSIGIWVDLLSRLAKRTRALVSSDGALARELFRTSETERLEAIAHKSLVQALKDEAVTYRNNWIGHGPVASNAEWQRRLSAAESTLARIRSVLGDTFIGWEMLRAGQGGNRAGVISTSVERLTGSQRAFRKGRVELREWPEEGALYMLEAGSSLPLRLAPLFTFKHSPASAEDTCYFYDRLEGDGVRWVSYHFEDQPEVISPSEEVVELIAELNALG